LSGMRGLVLIKMPKLIIVGSAPLDRDFSRFIENCDCVVRFNNCKNYGGFSGTRTDILFLSNSGDPAMHRTLAFLLQDRTPDQVQREMPYVHKANTVWFVRPRNPELLEHLNSKIEDNVPMKAAEIGYNRHGRDLAGEITRSLKIPEDKIRIVSPAFHSDIWERLISLGPTEAVVPSTGIIGIETVLKDPMFKKYKQKFLLGFGWEGWIGHPWELEKKLVQKYLNQGLLLDARKIHHRLLPRLSAGLKAHRRHL